MKVQGTTGLQDLPQPCRATSGLAEWIFMKPDEEAFFENVSAV
jgi:hypothetical protein